MLVYKITIAGEYIYIGATTKTLEDRMIRHFKAFKNDKLKNLLLYQKMNEYGKDKVRYEVLEDNIKSIDLLYEREKYWIQELKTFNENNIYGLNMTKGGLGNAGRRYKEDEKLKLKISKLGEKNPNSKLATDEVYNIKKSFVGGLSRKEIKTTFNIDDKILSTILLKSTWVDVGEEFNELIDKRLLKDKNDIIKVREEIRDLYVKGASVDELSEIYNYTIRTIEGMVNGLYKLREEDIKIQKIVLGIKKDFLASVSRKEIAKKYNVKPSYVDTVLSFNTRVSVGEHLNEQIKHKLESQKIPDEVIIGIKKAFLEGYTKKEISRISGVKLHTVSNIVKLKNHINIGEELNNKILELENKKNDIIVRIKIAYLKGLTSKEIAKEFNVSVGYVNGIISLKTHIKVGEDLNDKIFELRNKNK